MHIYICICIITYSWTHTYIISIMEFWKINYWFVVQLLVYGSPELNFKSQLLVWWSIIGLRKVQNWSFSICRTHSIPINSWRLLSCFCLGPKFHIRGFRGCLCILATLSPWYSCWHTWALGKRPNLLASLKLQHGLTCMTFMIFMMSAAWWIMSFQICHGKCQRN